MSFKGHQTMSNKFLLIIIILSVWIENVCCDSSDQPRIISQAGDFIFQSAQDKNITIRLAGSSRFLVNDINVLESLQKSLIPRSPSDDANIASLPNQVQSLKNDVRRMTNRLRRLENRTTSTQNRRISLLEARVVVLSDHVNEIEKMLRNDDCSPNPCKNGGTCYDLYENFHCECPKSWTGKSCEQDVDECAVLTGTDLGCQNNAACVNIAGSYRCDCTNGFTGTHCRDRGSDCSKARPGELCVNGACIPANNEKGYQCICDAGWKTNNVTQSCTVDVNECLETLVACHTSCINLPGSFLCGPCPSGYTGNGVTCRDIDECAINNGGCSLLPKVQCINTEGSHRCGNCPPGWSGDGRYCNQVETNACPMSNICHPLAKCEYISNIMVCVCPEGMTGSGYGVNGCTAGSANPCNDHQCQNGGVCVSHGSTYSCICPLGFDPPFCQSQNICSQHPCLNGGTCLKQDNSNEFRCVCPRDASGRLCQIKRNTCGTVIRDRTGDLKHPPEGGNYKANEACAWVIRTEDNLILNVTFSQFDVQSDPECGKDWLQINDGRSLATPLIGRFCGNQLPNGGNILSSQNTLFLWFRADNTTNAAGFSLKWNSIAPICGGQLDGQDHGVIKSPGYPGKSPPNRDCEWVISAPFGKRILLRFYEVLMDRSANCTKDSLIIYDTNEVLDHICETGVPAPKYTSSNVAKVHFHTDPYREDSLFQMHFETVDGKPGCGGLFTESEGKIMFTSDMKNCVFLIQQPPGTRIFIGFTKGDLSISLSIKIFDGKTDDDPMLFESFDGSLPTNLTSSGNLMLLVVNVRDSFLEGAKVVLYEANYKLVCGQELGEPLGGTFATPNHPKPYYAGLNCLYSIVGPVDSVVHLNITDYDISEYNEACDDDSDFIEIYFTLNGSPERHCKDVPMHVVAPSNHLRIGFHSSENPQRRRGIRADYYFEQIGCGGVLRDTKGSFKQLLPISFSNAYCEWILEAPENHLISLDLSYRRVGMKCAAGDADVRIFLNGTEYEGRLVQSLCGGEKRIVTTLPSNLATIFLKLILPNFGNAVSYGISVDYEFTHRSSDCSANYSILSGSIQSPGWPKEYSDSTDCVWIIEAPLGHKIELVPRNFSVEPSTRCDDDYLEIRNGPSDKSPLIGRYCGSKIPPHIPSFTNHLYLHFHSDSTFFYPGFDIPFQQTSTGCGGTLNSHRGSIASPHYPEISRGPVQCDWKITVSQGSTIDISITKLNPTTDFCSNNVLIIYDGVNSLAKKLPLNCSSTDTTVTLKSTQNVILVRYALLEIGAVGDYQFYLDYQTNCQQTLDASEGIIESPNFPDDYPNYLRCEWNIVGRKADTISLTFSHFELESHDLRCLYDTFEVIDMKGEEILQTHKICRNPMEMLTSDGNRFVIKFSTDFSNVAKGFRLEFKRNGCGGYATRSSGVIASPNIPYSLDSDCEWFIETTPGMLITLDLFDVIIETEKDDCSANGLIIKNEKNDSRVLLRECKLQRMPMTVTSHGTTLYIRFYTDSIRSRKYIKASYRTKEAPCGGIYRGNQGEIMSPNYPQNYSEKTYCEWMISVESSSTLGFMFEALDLPTSNNCSKSYVEVYDGIKTEKDSKLIGRYCTKALRTLIQTSSNRLNVIFNSDDGPTAKGFLLKYKKVCGGLVTGDSGILKSYVQDGTCVWHISAKDEGSKIVVNFMHIECHNDTGANITRGVKVSAGELSPPILSFCETHPPDFISDASNLFVTAQDVTFIAKYSTVETACGGLLTSLRGFFTSPYYPQTYPSNTECIWIIQAQPGNYLELNFIEMDIANSDDCNQDYLEVREKTSNGKLLGVFCSNILPTETFQVFEQFWIKFQSSEDSVGNGFKLSWTIAQVNEISGFNGQIRPPPIESIRSEQEPFQWRINVPRDNVILLSFKEYSSGLKLYDGFDSQALPIEIQLSPWEVTSSTSVILLISDNQLLDHFQINWKAISKETITESQLVQDCNETLVIGYGPIVDLESPGYPTGYSHDLRCQWLVKSDHPARHAVIEIYDARLEKLNDCPADYLKVSTSKNLVDWHQELKICDSPPKSRTALTVIHGTPYLKINFDTDSSVNRTGFSAILYTVCGGNLTGSIGRILDIDIHNTTNVEVIQNCTWHIEVRTGRKIKFTFEFPPNSVKNSSDQCENYAIIRDGIDDGAPILPPGRICSYKEFNGTVVTTTNRATVKYFNPSHNPFLPYDIKMWNLTYREYTECGGEVQLKPYASSLNITSPHYPNVPNPHTECIWTIVAPPGEAVQAEFVDRFDMNVRNCGEEFIELRDGSTELARQLGKFCIRPGTIRTSGNILYMRYLTDIAEPRNGFKVNVSISTCGGTFAQFSNVITSSNYPAPGGYPPNSVCDYVIKVTTFSRVNLTFIDVNLPFNEENFDAATTDHIKIYQVLQGDEIRVEEPLAVIYGNTTTMPAFQIDSNEVLVRMYSFRANNVYRGFKLKYERIFGVCFRDVSGESGLLTFSVAQRRQPMFILCRWKITVPKGRRVKLDVLQTESIPGRVDIVRNVKIHFFNDFQMLSRITIMDLSNISNTSSVLATDNKMFIRIFGASASILRRIKVAYSSSEISNCPDDITTDTGSLSVAGLDSTSNFFCKSDFILNGFQTIAFNISQLIVQQTDRRLPAFAVRFHSEGFMGNLRILHNNLTNGNVAIAIKHGSVSMLQSENIQLKKFEATFTKHACGGEYRIEQKFEIVLPNFTANYGALDCAWHLVTTVKQYDLVANFSFTLPCEDEFFAVHSGPSTEYLEIARLCRGVTFNTTRLRAPYAYMFYHTTAYSTSSELRMVFQRATNCGEKLTIQTGELLAFTPADYKNNLECVWDIQTDVGFYLRLEFMGRFYIEDSKNCTKDFLEIRKFEQGDWVALPRYCGRNLPSSINTTTERLQLIFRSDDSNTGDGFTLNIQKTCYAVFNVTSQAQIIDYPTKWSMTSGRLNCNYILQTDSSKYIRVKFNKAAFGLRGRCVLAQLNVKKRNLNGEYVELGPYCKENSVSEFRAQKYIALSYQALTETRGYEIEFALESCGGQITQPTWIENLKNEEGTGYTDNMNCVWNISAPAGHNIIIQFKYLLMEHSEKCTLDYVAIYRGTEAINEQQVAQLCGNLTSDSPSFHIEGNTAVIVAISDTSISKEGFSARILFSKACDERITLTETNSPVDIERDLEVGKDEVMACNLRIMGEPDFRIEILLMEIDLNPQNVTCKEECKDCNYLEFVDSIQAGSLSLGKYCSQREIKPKLISSFKDVSIQTYVDKQGRHRFKANLKLVSTGCLSQNENELDNDSEIKISSTTKPNGLYPANMHCTWRIVSQKNFEIRFQHFSLQNKSDVTGKCLDYVLIRHTSMYSKSNRDEHCGSVSSYVFPVMTFNRQAVAEITFHSDEAVESTGFTLIASIAGVCNRTFNFTSGIIGGTLSKNEPCLTDFDMPENYTVNIIIPGLHFRNSNCSESYIRLYDKKTNRQLYEDCSSRYSTRKIFTSTNKVRLDIKVASASTREILYYGSQKSLPPGCGGSFDIPQGIISSPNYQEYGNSSVCEWFITTTAPNRISMNLMDINMGSVCKSDYLEIIEIEANGNEKLVRSYCETAGNMSPSYESESNRIKIRTVTSADYDGTGWTLVFSPHRTNNFRTDTTFDFFLDNLSHG